MTQNVASHPVIFSYGLGGASANLQLGRQGPRLVADANGVEVRDISNTTLVNLKVANAVVASDVVNLGQIQTLLSTTMGGQAGLAIPLGALGNATSYTGAVTLSTATSLTNAIESLNTVLSHLVPSAPASFPTGSLTLTNTVGTAPLLAANSVPDHTGGAAGLAAGAVIAYRTVSGAITTNTLSLNNQSPNGVAADLTLSLLINNAVASSYGFTDVTAAGAGDTGTHGGIVISAQAAYPASTPGFWKSFSVAAAGSYGQEGINSLQMTSNEAGNTNVLFWVQDNLTATLVISNTSLSLSATGLVAYSSSVPHCVSGGSLTAGLAISNLAGETYYNGTPLTVSATNAVITPQSFSYASLGITTPIARQTLSALTVTPFTISINPSNVFAAGTLSALGTNVNGAGGSTTLSSTILLVKTGTYTAVDELNIPVTLLGSLPNANNAVRVNMTGGGTGVDTPTSSAFTSWNSAAMLAVYEAAVVAGVLSCNQTNYTSGYFPPGPNLSSQNSTQYATFSFQRASVSNFVINVTGSYSHCWIAMPGITDNSTISPHSISGVWWDTAVAYNGVGVPGDASNPNAGCAYNISNQTTGGSGSFAMSFGQQSSSNATGSEILVRFKLTTGQSITALSFS